MKTCVYVLILALAAFGLACEDSVVVVPLSPELGEEDEEQTGDKIFIVDRTGKKWDITHAVEEYGFEPEKFQYGLGPNAIKPILKPQMICPGEAGYPEDNDPQTVVGAALEGEVRAYPLTVMASHEIADEKFGDAHVAVAY